MKIWLKRLLCSHRYFASLLWKRSNAIRMAMLLNSGYKEYTCALCGKRKLLNYNKQRS